MYISGYHSECKDSGKLENKFVRHGGIMKALKYVGALLAIATLLFIFVANFSSVASNFECVGKTSAEGSSQPATIYIKLEEYRSWVGLWSESDASLQMEIPNTFVDYFGHVVKVGDQYQIFDFDKKLKGNFSTLSKALALSTPTGFFDGVCKRND